MELLLNLVWLVLSCASLTAWTLWRRRSRSSAIPGFLRGMLVITCVLALLFPVISISDDLSQTISLAEGSRLQDVLKAPELRGTYYAAPSLPELVVAPQTQSPIQTRSFQPEVHISSYELLRTASIEKRPPPSFV